jgi:anti-sigma regulatory factor (Ser/Thr protein kinase)
VEAVDSTLTDVEWIPVEDVSAPGRARASAVALSRRLGFTEHRIGEIAIAATELGTNLHRHAQAGVMLVRSRHAADDAAVELVAIDSGPGISDLAALCRDGNSSRGTLGIGLGAIMRMTTSFDCHSTPGRGTVMVAGFGGVALGRADVAVSGLTRAIHGETVCGDALSYRKNGDATIMMIADGLGHGELAAIASRAAVRVLQATQAISPRAILFEMDQALRGTRGAAVAVVTIHPAQEQLVFAGIGNVAVWIDDGVRRSGLASYPGIVGSYSKKMREQTVKLPRDPLIILHSDGLTSKWDLHAYPGIVVHSPDVIAATLLRDAGIRHDDASILVAKVQ